MKTCSSAHVKHEKEWLYAASDYITLYINGRSLIKQWNTVSSTTAMGLYSFCIYQLLMNRPPFTISKTQLKYSN